DVGAYFPHRVTYHPTCHSLRAIRVGDAPLRLLRAVRGIDLVELPRAEFCASADNSCLMQIGGALHRQRAGVGAVHLAEILASTEAEPYVPPGAPVGGLEVRS
ncbi:MAG: (Fe-S)-binding protein, partial [Actinobacteria bacterium]|nr:(Fe-S)-binding protein [Actinomycetota bacterium]